MKQTIKRLLKKIPVAITKNQQYDRQTRRVIERVCGSHSNCVDVGCHKGEVLDILLKFAPLGTHFCFEPLPDLFESLKRKYPPNCQIFDIGLSNRKGTTAFNYVLTNPSYSGFKKRKYDKAGEQETTIRVKTERLDTILPEKVKINFIKIDVEGAELEVLQGAVKTIRSSRPVIVFEHGLGAADCYGTTPRQVYDLLHSDCNMLLSTMKKWLNDEAPLSKEKFVQHFEEGLDYYFIAYPM